MRLSWDKAGERLYETGVDRGVFYPFTTGGKYGSGVAWNGLTAVNETPSGAEPTALWANNKKYLTLMVCRRAWLNNRSLYISGRI